MSFSWRESAVRAEAMAGTRTIIGRLEISRTGLAQYEYSSDGSLCVSSDQLSKVLGFALLTRHGAGRIGTSWQFQGAELRLRISVEGLGRLRRTLPHFPDALLPPQTGPRFTESAKVVSSYSKLIREAYDALAGSDLIRIRVRDGVLSFIDPQTRDTWFQPSGLTATGNAETTVLKSSIDYASRAVMNTDSTGLEMRIIDGGFFQVIYEYEHATLSYVAAAVIEPE